jgi:hypothetical protein
MDEAKRFLRYVTPGLVFLTETLILLWLIEPDVTYTILKDFSKESGFGLVIATLLASGGVGFMFSVVHHYLHWLNWHDQYTSVDHRNFIDSLRARGIIRLRKRETGEVLPDAVKPNRFQAWTILSGLWHERVARENSLIKSADPRTYSLSDLVHSVGTARVAAITAWIFALLILWRSCSLTTDAWAIARFIIGNILAAGFVLLYHAGYRRTGEAAQQIAEQVLDDALTQEQEQTENGAPIDTYVAL